MANTDTKQLILVAIKGTHTEVVFGPAISAIVMAKKKELIKSGNWNKPWRFQIRTPDGFNHIKILAKK